MLKAPLHACVQNDQNIMVPNLLDTVGFCDNALIQFSDILAGITGMCFKAPSLARMCVK